jgi:tRNA(adenine34) deaminase
MSIFKNNLMLAALDEAKKAASQNEVPVGAIIQHPQQGIIARTHNLVETTQDPTAHAEILAIRSACKQLNSRYLSECDLYTTLEPCAMCAYAITLSRVGRLFFAAYDPKTGAVENGVKIFSTPQCNHKPEIYGGIMEQEAANLLEEFFKKLRNNKKN